jgi:hypothetical protein
MKEVLTKVEREKGFTYRVDKQGNVLKESYNWLKDPFTLVVIAILILGGMYYLQLSDMRTTEANFEEACFEYIELRDNWIAENPGQIPTMEQVFEFAAEGEALPYE